MKLDEFNRFLDLHGTDLDLWPEPGAARRMLAANVNAQRHYASLREVENLFMADRDNNLPAATSSIDTLLQPADLLRRIEGRLEHADNKPRQPTAVSNLNWLAGRTLWLRAIAAALPLVCGLGLGLTVNAQGDNQAQSEAQYGLDLWVYEDSLTANWNNDDAYLERVLTCSSASIANQECKDES